MKDSWLMAKRIKLNFRMMFLLAFFLVMTSGNVHAGYGTNCQSTTGLIFTGPTQFKNTDVNKIQKCLSNGQHTIRPVDKPIVTDIKITGNIENPANIKKATINFAGRRTRRRRDLTERRRINPEIVLTGSNFGNIKGYSTVSIGGKILKVVSWSDTRVVVEKPTTPSFPKGAPLILVTSTGFTKSVPINLKYSSRIEKIQSLRTVHVQAGSLGGDGSSQNPYATITEALNHLPTYRPRYVKVDPGIYNEHIQITESDIYIIGSGPKETTINGVEAVNIFTQGDGGAGPIIFIGKGGNAGGSSVSNIKINGFTIVGGSVKDHIGGGIFADYGNSNLDINNNIISRNTGYYGGGIWLHYSNHNVKIWSNTIEQNGNYGGYGGGISVNDEPEYTSHPYPAPDHIVDDFKYTTPPGTYEIFNNLIYHNYSPDYGGGICLYEIKDKLLLYGNMIIENESEDHGGGIFFEDTGPIELYGNTLLRNIGWDDGGAISFEDVGDNNATIHIKNNLIAENMVDDRGLSTANGGGISFDDTFKIVIENNTITGNIVAGSVLPAGGGIDAERNGHEYASDNWPDSIYMAPGFSDPVIKNNIIWNNWRMEYSIRKFNMEDFRWRPGTPYSIVQDNIHVDSPIQPEWMRNIDTKNLSIVTGNIIHPDDNDYNNNSTNPLFTDAANWNWTTTAPAAAGKGATTFLNIPKSIMGKVVIPSTPNHF